MFEKKSLSKLRTQLIQTFMVGSIGIVIAIGLPVVLLINRQASSQTNLLLTQAVLTTQASIAREQSDLQNLALLIAQRPTLRQLLEEGNSSSLNRYLDTLRNSVDLDLLLICDANQEVVGSSTSTNTSGLCETNKSNGFFASIPEQPSMMFGSSDLQDSSSSSYQVILGKNAATVLAQLEEESGLNYVLVGGDQVVASSNPKVDFGPVSLKEFSNEWVSAPNGKSYLFSNIALPSDSDLKLIGAMNVDEQVQAQRNLSRSFLWGLIFVIMIAFGLGIWLSQRLSSPLNRLANVAEDFSHGNLESPVSVRTNTKEISQLANTLEDARVALDHSMNQLQSEKAWVEHILNSIVEGILTLDGQNRVTFASDGMRRIAEHDIETMIDQKVDHLFLPMDGEIAFSEQLPSIGQQQSISVKLKNGQGKLLSVSRVKLVPPEERGSSHALVIRDVTNEEYIHRLLGDFLANITHEFRTPLAALEASTELMLDNLKHLSSSELEELLISLNLGIIDLQTLIDNLIEAASIEAGRFKISQRPVEFVMILEDALNIIRPLAEKYRLNLEVPSAFEASCLVMADHRRTVQVLVNLLSNAIKHSPEEGRIQVKYFIEGDVLQVEVIDEGGGIPKDQRSNLFKRFAHLDSSGERARQGAGLGLSVVKAIVEAQNGDVGITNGMEDGTSIWFTLPLADLDEQ